MFLTPTFFCRDKTLELLSVFSTKTWLDVYSVR